MSRVQVQHNLSRPERLRTVDTFSQPIIDAPDFNSSHQLAQLGESLGRFEPTLTNFFQIQLDRQRDADLKESESDALQNQEDFRKITREGLIREGHSPWYVHGYLKTVGRLKAAEAFKDASVALAEDQSLRMTTDPGALSGFLREQFAPHLEDASGSELEVLLPELQRYESQLIQRHVAGVADYIETDRKEKLDTEINQTLDGFLEQPDGDKNHQGIVAFLQGRKDDYIADGGDPREVNDLMVNAVLAKAETELNRDLPDVLREIPTGTGKLGDITRYRQAIESSKERIDAGVSHRERLERQAVEQHKKDQKESFEAGMIQLLAENPIPDQKTMDALIVQGAAVGVTPSTIRSAQSNIIEFTGQENPMVLADLERQVYAGEFTHGDIIPAMADGRIRDQQTASRLHGLIESYRKNGSILQHSTVNNAKRNLRKVVSQEQLGVPMDASRVLAANQAEDDFNRLMLEWANSREGEFTQDELLEKSIQTKNKLSELYGDEHVQRGMQQQRQQEQHQQVRSKNMEASIERSGDELQEQSLQRMLEQEDRLNALPEEAAQFLIDNPGTADEFNAATFPGAAEMILNSRSQE